MIIKRATSFFIDFNAQQRQWKNENKCPMCGLHRNEWKRRRDWLCCSNKCSDDMGKITHWPQKYQRLILERENWTCQKCGFKPTYPDGEHFKRYSNHGFVVDHIIPIAIGGGQWDMNNMQLLCSKCNKEKTKQDMAVIAKHRCKEKQILNNQHRFDILLCR